jgi:integrase
LGRVFDYAARHLDWHGSNPVRDLEKDERPRDDEREKRILSSDELGRLLDSVENRHRIIFTFAAATGARLGEVLGIRWHALDFDNGTVHLSHQLDRRGEYVALKTTRSRRTIEIPPSLIGELRAHKMRAPFSGDHDYVSLVERRAVWTIATSAGASWPVPSSGPSSTTSCERAPS